MDKRRLIILIAGLLIAAWMSYEMMSRSENQLLWGWRPLVFLVSGWVAILSLVTWRLQARSERMRWIYLSTFSGLLLSAGFPPSYLTPLVFIGFVPLLFVEADITRVKGGVARWTVFKMAFNAFFFWNILTTWWLLNTSFLPGIVASFLNSVFMAAVFVCYHQARNMLSGLLPLLAFIAFWISFEYLHLHWELSWPWLNLGHAFAQYPAWIQWYEYSGIFGGSLWVLLVNYLIWQLVDKWVFLKRFSKPLLSGITAIIVIPVLIGGFIYYTYETAEGEIEVAVIQPNFEPHYEKFYIDDKVQLERFLRLSREVVTEETEYLVFPETSFGLVALNSIEYDPIIRDLRQFVEEYPRLKLVTGLTSIRYHDRDGGLESIRAVPRGGDTVYFDIQNSAIQLARDQPIEPYFKSKLVPGPEFFPFRKALPFITPLIEMLDGSVEGMTKQPERAVFSSDVADVAPIICYESIYGEYTGGYLRKGADLLFIVTNDGWWDRTPGHVQHLKLGALRAIEHRRPIARSANTGVSCFINARGDILQPTEYGVEAAISAKLPVVEGYTFYTRWGDVIARLAVFIAGIMFILTVVRSILPPEKRGKTSG